MASSILLDQTFTDRSASHELSIRWTTLGPDDGEPLIFIHGTPWSSFVWTAYAKSLSSRFKIYLFDNPGYGLSPGHRSLLEEDHSNVDISFASLARSFASIYKSWSFSPDQPPHVIAHDIGGIIALRAHLLHGCSYASLCLIDVVSLRPFGSPFYRLVGQNQAVFERIPDSIHRGILGAYIAGAAFKPLPRDVADALAAPWAAGGSQGQTGFIRQIVQAEEQHVAEVEDRYRQVGAVMPVKIIWGKEDTWIPVAQAARLAEAVQAKETVIVEEAGHLIMFDQPERLATEIGVWLMSLGMK
ncbi:hypothetical protein FE257_003616 [Aspergillus nanangensis]|uniref:AB hydrolase-1 domain-containing protein n=1 Tax=Aspergillus nanangensis TaxID=2582783 RepID=A0AAD4CRY1_ASPNN|nr:hypothetical protein FE257_003616 [Aspergillus nanangensis]